MAFSIFQQMEKPGSDLYYEPDFQYIIETHLGILKVENAVVEEIPMDIYHQYEGDFYGYLMFRGVPPHLHWINLRVNGMTNPNQFAKDMRNPLTRTFNNRFIRPNDNLISGIVRFYTTRKFK